MGVSGIAGITVMAVALWVWNSAPSLALLLASQAAHPQWELWAVRCGAIAAGLGAQVLFLGGVVCAFYDERAGDEVVRILVGTVGTVAMVASLVLALAGR